VNLWGRLGISVAIVAMFSIVMTEVLQDKAFYQSYRWAICAVFLAMGAFLLVVGRFVNTRIRESRRDEDGESPKGPFLLVNLEYWGVILSIFGVIVIFIVPYKKVEARAVAARTNARPRTNAPVAKKIVVAPTNEPAPPPPKPVKFPPLKLQGIVYKQERASALLNGRTYFIGDYIGEAKVVAIGPTNAVLEIEGQQRELILGE
jgi:hypothetical protein